MKNLKSKIISLAEGWKARSVAENDFLFQETSSILFELAETIDDSEVASSDENEIKHCVREDDHSARRVDTRMTFLTKEQRAALKKVYDRNPTEVYPKTYREFRKEIVPVMDCIMIKWCGMWLGIEKDGYTHS